jgi:uncharacterized protein
VDEPTLSRGGLEGAVIRLCRRLRQRGLAATPAESIDATRALGVVDLGDREDVRLALRTVLVSRREDLDTFDELFDDVWRLTSAVPAAPAHGSGMPSGPRRFPLASRQQQAPVSLQNWMKPDEAGEALPLQIRAASDREALSDRDFSAYGGEDAAAFRRLAARIARRLALRKSRRWRAVRRGERIDLRRTARLSLRTGGEAIRLERRSRKVRRTKVVALCDVSGSMELYARFLLQFMHALQNSFARVETFAFATRLSRITETLRGSRYEESLRHLGRDVRDWSGGTRIGGAIQSFLETNARLVDRRTIVIIMSDGWDVGDPEVLAEAMRALHRRAGRIIWLNPLMGAPDFSPATRGMRAALPHVDVLAPGHSLAALEAVVGRMVI